jgi:signal transduction histidine kinase
MHALQKERTQTPAQRVAAPSWCLVPALESLISEFLQKHAVLCELHIDPALPPMSKECGEAIFRIAEEALDNVARHAAATRVEIALECQARDYYFGVFDDGRGLGTNAFAKTSSGLFRVQARALVLGGVVTLTSAAGMGTSLKVRLPADSACAQYVGLPLHVNQGNPMAHSVGFQ